MNKTLLFALLSISSLVMATQEPIYSVSSFEHLQKKTKTPPPETSAEQAGVAKLGQPQGPSEIMIIYPEARAKDLVSAFLYLKKMSVATQMGVKLIDGTVITGILDMEVMPGGTIVIIKINTMKGQEYRAIKTETIDALINV